MKVELKSGRRVITIQVIASSIIPVLGTHAFLLAVVTFDLRYEQRSLYVFSSDVYNLSYTPWPNLRCESSGYAVDIPTVSTIQSIVKEGCRQEI